MDPIYYILLAALAVAAIAALVARYFHRHFCELQRQNAALQRQNTALQAKIPIPKTPEQRLDEQLAHQLEAVTREWVTFGTRRVMGLGEFGLFRAALRVTRQPSPSGPFPYYVFPQVSLGEIISTSPADKWYSREAHRAINSKRCDLLIADRDGYPIAVFEYQGRGHDIGGTAMRRDEIKRIALERAGVRFIEIEEGTTFPEIQRIIRYVLAPQSPAPEIRDHPKAKP